MFRRLVLSTALAALMAAQAQTQAQAQDPVDQLFTQSEQLPAPAPKPDGLAHPVDGPEADKVTAGPDPEVLETQRLNAEVEAHNQQVRDSNLRAEQDYERRQHEHAQWVTRLEEEHQAEQAAYEAEIVRQQQQHEANLAAWRRRVAECQRGVIAACDPSTIR